MQLTQSPNYDVRYSIVTDLSYLRSWLSTPEVMKWYPPGDEKELENFVQVWIGFCRFSASLTATFEKTPVAMATLFLMPYRKVAHHCMFQIVVDPHFQKKGVGLSLLKNLKHLAKTYFHLEIMHTEIFEGCPAISLFKKTDFRQFAKQENYVKENGKYLSRLLWECDLT